MTSDWIPYNDRPEWKDVTPVPQNDGPSPVVPIAYTKRFTSTMDYFRAILKSKEISQRALDLTADVIEVNPANYTAWHYRRLCLYQLGSDLSQELSYLNTVIQENQKNYQVWYHRSTVLEKYGKVDQSELEFIESVLKDDSKNYHAWAHRQWVVKQFNLWDKEMEYLDKMMALDFRNNSAWNHRFFVIKSTKGKAAATTMTTTAHFQDLDLDDAVRLQEVEYAFQFINKHPNNESAWNYVFGMASYKGGSVQAFGKVQELTDALLKRAPVNVHAHWVLVECIQFNAQVKKDKSLLQEAVPLVEQLIKLDGIREKYWQFKKVQLVQ